MPQIIGRIGRRFGATRAEWGATIDEELINVWVQMGGVKPTQAYAFYRLIMGKGGKKESLPSRKAMTILDEIILDQAVTLGWRITCSLLVLFRFSRWSDEPFAPGMFDRFGKALANSVRILSRDRLPPIDDPGLRKYKACAVAELRTLLREMRVKFACASENPSTKEVGNWFLRTLSDRKRYPWLVANLWHWIIFLQNRENSEILKLQLTGRLTPAAVFDTWLGWCKGHEPEYLRKHLARRK
jgi:hypothetical protein